MCENSWVQGESPGGVRVGAPCALPGPRAENLLYGSAKLDQFRCNLSDKQSNTIHSHISLTSFTNPFYAVR